MKTEDLIIRMEREWSPPDGILWAIRTGHYDAQKAGEFLGLLQSIRLGDDDSIPRRLVSLVWYVPTFLEWQRERINESGYDADAYELFINAVRNEMESILGVP